MSALLRPLTEGGASLEEGNVNFQALHNLGGNREVLMDLVAALNEGARLSKAMGESVHVLDPSFEAARDNLLEIIGRS
jgi:type II secretory pathway component PulF